MLKILCVSLLSSLSLVADTIEVKFDDDATLLGSIKVIETKDNQGNAVSTYFFETEDEVVVVPSEKEDPGNTNEALEGMEIRLLSGDNEALKEFVGRDVMVIAKVTGGNDLHLYNFGLYLESAETIIPRS